MENVSKFNKIYKKIINEDYLSEYEAAQNIVNKFTPLYDTARTKKYKEYKEIFLYACAESEQ